MEPQVEGVAAEDVPHVVAAHDHQLLPHFFGDALEARGAHLARGSDREAVARDDEGLAAVDARPEVGHQVAERARLPPLVEGLETLGHAVGRWGDLVGVDRVELPGRGALPVPENQCLAADQPIVGGRRRVAALVPDVIKGHARLQPGGLDPVHAFSS